MRCVRRNENDNGADGRCSCGGELCERREKCVLLFSTTALSYSERLRRVSIPNSKTNAADRPSAICKALFVCFFLAIFSKTNVADAATESTLDVLRDQPGASPEEIQERSRRCENLTLLACTADELETKSICGSDGRTYSNVCEIKKMACHGNPVQLYSKGAACPEKQKCTLERTFQIEQARRQNRTDSAFIPECYEDGGYSTVQCHKKTGYCWCVTTAGRPVPSTAVHLMKPNCTQFGKQIRRANFNQSGTRKTGCNSLERSTFSNNLMQFFRTEYEKDPRNQGAKINDGSDGIILASPKQIIDWKFEQLDIDNDRKISKPESKRLRAFVRNNLEPKICARRLAKQCDLDMDNFISYSEWSVCLDVDVGTSLRMFQLLNTSKQMAQQQQQQIVTQTTASSATERSVHTSMAADGEVAQDGDRTWRPGHRKKFNDRQIQRQNNRRQQQANGRRTSQFGGHGAGSLVEVSRKTALSGASSSDFNGLLRETPKEPEEKEQEPEPTDCQSQRRKAQEEHTRNPNSGIYIPQCVDGNTGRLYESRQCHNGVNFCWCVEPETGKPIPGTSKPRLYRQKCPSVQKNGTNEEISDTNIGASRNGIKGCNREKRQKFFMRLFATLSSSMIASGHAESDIPMSPIESAVRWKFSELDKNENGKLERKEWKSYRDELKMWRHVRKCGRNFLRSCDADGDKRITLDEWLQCTWYSSRSLQLEGPAQQRRRGQNPFETILDPNQ